MDNGISQDTTENLKNNNILNKPLQQTPHVLSYILNEFRIKDEKEKPKLAAMR